MKSLYSIISGLLPFQYACVRGGLVISNMGSIYDILDWETTSNLICLSAIFLIPAFLIEKFSPPLPDPAPAPAQAPAPHPRFRNHGCHRG